MNKKYVLTIFIISFLNVPKIQAITYIQNMSQVWGLSVQNKSKIPLAIVDEIYYPQHTKVRKEIINPGGFYRSQWINAAVGRDYKTQQTRNFSWVLSNEPPRGRIIFIWGDCKGSVGSTNMITIGNADGVTYQAVPSGTYTVINPPNGTQCEITLANPINTQFTQ